MPHGFLLFQIQFSQGALLLSEVWKNNFPNKNIWECLPCGFGLAAERGDCLSGTLPFIPWAASLRAFCSTSLAVALAAQALDSIMGFGQMLLPEK